MKSSLLMYVYSIYCLKNVMIKCMVIKCYPMKNKGRFFIP